MVEIRKIPETTIPATLPPPKPPIAGTSYPFSQDVLVSMGKTVGFGLFRCLRFVAISSASWMVKFFGPEAFLDPKKLSETFEDDPFKVLDRLLYLFDRSPDVCEKILLKLAKDWKENLLYEESKPQKRMALVSRLDQLFEDLILTKAQREFKEKICMEELTIEEESVTRDQDWNARKSPSPEAKKARKLFLELQNLQKMKNDLWDTCYAQYILADWNLFKDLKLECKEEHLEKEEHISFGHFIERIMKVRDPRVLQQNDIFNDWVSFLKTAFKKLTHDEKQLLSEYPSIKRLIEKSQRILGDETKVNRLQILISKLVAVYYPSGKSSPQRERSFSDGKRV
ncbi:MAG: hypothetical protein K1000chlam2_01037 [Chlamydiae bacterium]|nr:hypothetical protein [Chlamydiota bacterium]